MTEKIKILFLAANPVDACYRPRLDEEAREISIKLLTGRERESFEFTSKWAVRPNDLQEAFLRFGPNVVHFSGHGNKKQGIILEDEYGKMKAVSKEALSGLFERFKESVRVVILNACYSKWQLPAFTHIIDYTIGMDSQISDKTAVAFSSSFYQALTYGRSVKEAFELGINEIELEGLRGVKTPHLFVRKGVDTSRPFLVPSLPGLPDSTASNKPDGSAALPPLTLNL